MRPISGWRIQILAPLRERLQGGTGVCPRASHCHPGKSPPGNAIPRLESCASAPTAAGNPSLTVAPESW